MGERDKGTRQDGMALARHPPRREELLSGLGLGLELRGVEGHRLELVQRGLKLPHHVAGDGVQQLDGAVQGVPGGGFEMTCECLRSQK